MNTSFGISKYRSVKLILDKIEISQRESLSKFRDRISENLVRAESRSKKADLGSRSIAEAARSTTRLSELDPLEEFDKKDRLISHAMEGDSNFIHIYANISQGLKLAWKTINSISSGLDLDEIVPSLDGAETARERMHDLSVEYQLNNHSCETFSNSCGQASLRGLPGLFARAVEGIETLKRMNAPRKIVINCLLHRGNENMMGQMADLARSLGVSLWVCPAKEGILKETGGTNKQTLASRESEQQAARELLALKKKGYPINNSRTYLQRYLLNMTHYVCRVPLVYVTVTPEGNVTNCFNNDKPYGNVRASPFDESNERLGSPAGGQRHEGMLEMQQSRCGRCIIRLGVRARAFMESTQNLPA